MKKTTKGKYIFYTFLLLLIVLLYNGFYKDIPVDDLKKKYTNKFSKFIEIDGVQVLSKNEGKGMPIVLIHGIESSLHPWYDWKKNS